MHGGRPFPTRAWRVPWTRRSLPRPFTQKTTFGNLAQQVARLRAAPFEKIDAAQDVWPRFSPHPGCALTTAATNKKRLNAARSTLSDTSADGRNRYTDAARTRISNITRGHCRLVPITHQIAAAGHGDVARNVGWIVAAIRRLAGVVDETGTIAGCNCLPCPGDRIDQESEAAGTIGDSGGTLPGVPGDHSELAPEHCRLQIE